MECLKNHLENTYQFLNFFQLCRYSAGVSVGTDVGTGIGTDVGTGVGTGASTGESTSLGIHEGIIINGDVGVFI